MSEYMTTDDLTMIGVDGVRRSFDEHYDTMMEVEQDPTGAYHAIQNQHARIEELEAALATARQDALEEAAGRIEEIMKEAIREYGPVKSVTDIAVIKMLDAIVSAIFALVAQEEPKT